MCVWGGGTLKNLNEIVSELLLVTRSNDNHSPGVGGGGGAGIER